MPTGHLIGGTQVTLGEMNKQVNFTDSSNSYRKLRE